MRAWELFEKFEVDPATIDATIEFDPETVTKEEFNDMLKDIREWKNKGVMSWKVNGKEVASGEEAAREMKKLIQHRINAAEKENKKWAQYTWDKGPHKDSAELVPVRWLKRLRGNDPRIEVNTGYNPDTDDWDRGSLEDLAQSLKTRGPQEPVLIVVGYEDGYAFIGEGNHRIAAAEMAGIDKLPARVYWYRTAKDKREPKFTHDVSDDIKFELGKQEYTSLPSKVFKSLENLNEVTKIKLGSKSRSDIINRRLKDFMEEFIKGTEPHPMNNQVRLFGPVGLTVRPFDGEIHISDIITYDEHGKGHATKALAYLKSLANEFMVPLSGIAKAYSTDTKHIRSTEQLKDWYRKNGFEVTGDDIFYDPNDEDNL